MSVRFVIARIFGAAIATVVFCFALASFAQAQNVPIKIEYSGTGHLVMAAEPPPGDPIPPNIAQVGARGSFGAQSVTIMTKFVPQPPPAPVDRCKDEGVFYFLIGYTNLGITFADGSQLFARGVLGDDGWACLNPLTGESWGEAHGSYVGGAGRFEGASGTFTSPFVGNELYYPFIGNPSGIGIPEFEMFAIRGSIEGTLTFD